MACRFDMELEVESFVSTLAKFTGLLHNYDNITDKSIECVKVLLEIARSEGNFLKNSWVHIIRCMSKVDYLHLL